MASIRRQGDAFEIRECVVTDKGPRQRALVHFRGVLTPEIVDQARERARRPFDREALLRRAREQGVPIADKRRSTLAGRLLAHLHRGGPVDPTLVGLLRDALGSLPAEPVPSHLVDVVDWVGQSERERGRALRGLLRTASRVHRSRQAVRDAPRSVFPRFCSDRSEPDAR